MVCWIKRAKRLGVAVPVDEEFEKDLMHELGAKSHAELEDNLKFIHDETFEAIVESIVKRRRREPLGRKETPRNMYA